jgi:hypothetical protein
MAFSEDRRTKVNSLTVISSASLLFALVMNFLANYLPLNNITTAEVSDQYYSIFTPAGFTFIIWGVIYISLALFMVFIIKGVISNEERPKRIISEIGWYFAASSLFNGIWIVTWHYQRMLLSLIMIIGLLFSLLALYFKFKNSEIRPGSYLIPFSIYLGWATVATIANIVTFEISVNWNRFGLPPEGWLTVLLLLVLGVSAYFVLRQKDASYGLVIVWALTGITVARWNEFGGSSYPVIAAIVAAALVVSFLAIKVFFVFSADSEPSH